MKTVLLISLLSVATSIAASITGFNGGTLSLSDGSSAAYVINSGTPELSNVFSTNAIRLDVGESITISFAPGYIGGSLTAVDIDTNESNGTFDQATVTSNIIVTLNPVNFNIDNTLAPTQNVQNATFLGNVVTIANTGTDNGSSTWAFGINGITVNGTPTVPEPSATALLGLGALSLLTRRKR